MRPAAALLALLGRAGASAPPPADTDWAAVVEIAGWHGLEPLVAHRLDERALLPALPTALRDRLALAAAVARLREVARRRQLGEALAALAAAGVDAVPLKGAVLAEHGWPHPALRRMSDLDLLLPPGALDAGRRALAPLGYASDAVPSGSPHHAPPLHRAGALPIELHATINPCAPPFRLPLAAVLARAVPARVAGASVRVLEPVDLLLHLATHLGHGHVLGASLTGVLDVLAWTERHGAAVAWDDVVARARDAGAARFVHGALALAARALGAEVPAACLGALRAAGDDAVVEHARRLLVAPPALLLGAKAATDPRDGALARTRRLARGAAARWASLGRLLLHPAEGRDALRHVLGVRAVRRWAAG